MFSLRAKRRKITKQGIKICILGDGGVGKTSFLKALIADLEKNKKYKFSETYDATPEENSNICRIKLTSQTDDEMEIYLWDTAGQEYSNDDLRECFIANTDAAIILYDIQNANTRHNVNSWITKIRSISAENLPALIVGNKMDQAKTTTGRENVIRECRFNKIENIETLLFSVKKRKNYSTSEKGISQVLIPLETILKMYTKDTNFKIKNCELTKKKLVN
jgi:small GTP-binding protein